MKQLYVTNNEVDLQMILGLLDSQGIASQVKVDGAGGYFRTAGADFMLYKRVFVRDEEFQKAMDIAKGNGFEIECNKVEKAEKTDNSPKTRNNLQVWTARMVLVIFLVIVFGNILYSLISNIISYIS